jgi:hypothetical protein
MHREHGEQELEWIDEEQHQHEDGHGEHARERIVEAVAAVIRVVRVPERHQRRETDHECREAAHHVEQAVEGVRHLECNHQQRDREGEHGVREALDTRYFAAAPAELGFASRRERQAVTQSSLGYLLGVHWRSLLF